MSVMFFIQFAIVLPCILIDAQADGIGSDVPGDAGLAVSTFDFHLEPTSPPIGAMLMIITVASAAASIQASGGLNYMIKIVTRVLHRSPKYTTFIAPTVTHLLTVLADTRHVVYSVLSVIAGVSHCDGIRPSRPLTIVVIASQLAIVASPIAAAVVVCIIYFEPQRITIAGVLKVTVPSTIFGIGLVCVLVSKLGEELKDDPHYQKLLTKPEYVKAHEKNPMEHTNFTVSPQAKLSVGIFLAVALLVVVMGVMPGSRPTFQTEEGPKLMGMTHTIEVVMLSAAALIILLCKPDDNVITRGSIFRVEMRAIIAVFDVAWLGDMLIHGHLAEVRDTASHLVETTPWTFAIVLFILSVLVSSQGATVAAPFPIVISLDIPAPVIIGTSVAVSGRFFIPSYGPVIAVIDFDSTGPIKVDKYIFNHSFMIPGLLSLIFNLIFGLMFTEALLRT